MSTISIRGSPSSSSSERKTCWLEAARRLGVERRRRRRPRSRTARTPAGARSSRSARIRRCRYRAGARPGTRGRWSIIPWRLERTAERRGDEPLGASSSVSSVPEKKPCAAPAMRTTSTSPPRPPQLLGVELALVAERVVLGGDDERRAADRRGLGEERRGEGVLSVLGAREVVRPAPFDVAPVEEREVAAHRFACPSRRATRDRRAPASGGAASRPRGDASATAAARFAPALVPPTATETGRCPTVAASATSQPQRRDAVVQRNRERVLRRKPIAHDGDRTGRLGGDVQLKAGAEVSSVSSTHPPPGNHTQRGWSSRAVRHEEPDRHAARRALRVSTRASTGRDGRSAGLVSARLVDRQLGEPAGAHAPCSDAYRLARADASRPHGAPRRAARHRRHARRGRSSRAPSMSASAACRPRPSRSHALRDRAADDETPGAEGVEPGRERSRRARTRRSSNDSARASVTVCGPGLRRRDVQPRIAVAPSSAARETVSSAGRPRYADEVQRALRRNTRPGVDDPARPRGTRCRARCRA